MTDTPKVKVLFYDQFKVGYDYHATFIKKHGEYTITSLEQDIPLPGLSLFSSHYNTYAVRTANHHAVTYADLCLVDEDCMEDLSSMMRQRCLHPEHFIVDGDVCIIFLRRSLLVDSDHHPKGRAPMKINMVRITRASELERKVRAYTDIRSIVKLNNKRRDINDEDDTDSFNRHSY